MHGKEHATRSVALFPGHYSAAAALPARCLEAAALSVLKAPGTAHRVPNGVVVVGQRLAFRGRREDPVAVDAESAALPVLVAPDLARARLHAVHRRGCALARRRGLPRQHRFVGLSRKLQARAAERAAALVLRGPAPEAT